MSSPSPSPSPFNSLHTRYQSFRDANHAHPSQCDSTDDHRLCRQHGHIPGHNVVEHNMAAVANNGAASTAGSRCCCQRSDCAYLEHNNAALDALERDLEKAARLGQALLSRHETYVAETQQEHEKLNVKITELEAERLDLQSSNEKIVAENRELLEKLDTINKSYCESDDTVKNLEALLRDTETEVRRLNVLARRAEELEAQVHDLDRERLVISQKLDDSEQESKSALNRWRESEKRLRFLETELEKIEWEAKREFEKHEEIVARLERERTLERELGGAEGRLKGAAALQGIQAGTNDNVVSHFVRDILQDNANLQAGIVELRELLQSSNDEVQNLRQHVIHHQPVEESAEAHRSPSLPLDQQLGWEQPAQSDVQREVHVHHHYHAKLAAKGSRTPSIRKRSGRRTVMPGYITTPESSIPSTPISRPKRYNSSPMAPLQLHQPQPRRDNRWSVHSAATMASTISSLPSSPRSYFDRYSSIFDRIDPGEDSSRPTSPEPEPFSSPAMPSSEVRQRKPSHLDAFEEAAEDANPLSVPPVVTPPITSTEHQPTPQTILRADEGRELTPKPSQILTPSPSQPIDMPAKTSDISISVLSSPRSLHIEPLAPETQSVPQEFIIPDHDTPSPSESPFLEELPDNEPSPPPSRLRTPVQDEQPDLAEPFPTSPAAISIRPTLRRSGSSDSISVAGMDIHIPKRHSPEYTPQRIRSYFTPSALPSTALSHLSTTSKQPLTSLAETTASASQFNTLATSRGIGEGRRGLETIFVSSAAHIHREVASADAQSPGTGVAGRLGGWVRSKWGVAPTRSTGDLRSVSASHAITPSRRPKLATLLEAPVMQSEPEVSRVSHDANNEAFAANAGTDATASATQTSPPRAIPGRAASISTTSSGSTLGKRGGYRGVSSGGTSRSVGSGGGSLGTSVAFGNSMRMPGINQKGAIPGFWAMQQKRAPSQVEVQQVDEGALREGMEGSLAG